MDGRVLCVFATRHKNLILCHCQTDHLRIVLQIVLLLIDLRKVNHYDAGCIVEQLLNLLLILLLSDIGNRPSHVLTPKPVNPIHFHKHISLGIRAEALALTENTF